MKGFKPTGYGPSAGFKFPSHFGFTGSTGNVTQVSAHTRVKPVIPKLFADGGFVREDNPRMKEESGSDGGSPLVRRARSYNQADQESGGKGPLRPGYAKGGANWIAGATKNKGALHRALGVPEGTKIPAKKMAKAANSGNPTMRKRAALANTLGKMHKADGGTVRRPASAHQYTFGESVAAVPGALRELGRYMVDKVKDKMYNRQRTVEGRNQSVDEAVSEASTGDRTASNYAKGGKAKKAFGGRMGIGGPQRIMPMTPPPGGRMTIPAMPGRPMMMRAKGGKAKRMGYAKGGKAKRMGYAQGGAAKKKCM